MTLPEPPAGPTRQLIHTTWDLACEALSWPTFGRLDRRLDSRYDIQALDVLREVPPGFLYGVGPGSPVYPTDSQEIGLTVAGINACPNTSEILSVFLQFVQTATQVERGWEPLPDQPDAPPSLSETEFAARAPDLPAAGRGQILELLFLVLKTEQIGWGGYSADADGHWTFTFTRDIRKFRNVQNLDDYWARRYKPWEAKRVTSVPVNTMPGPFGRAFGIGAAYPAQPTPPPPPSDPAQLLQAQSAQGQRLTEASATTKEQLDDLERQIDVWHSMNSTILLRYVGQDAANDYDTIRGTWTRTYLGGTENPKRMHFLHSEVKNGISQLQARIEQLPMTTNRPDPTEAHQNIHITFQGPVTGSALQIGSPQAQQTLTTLNLAQVREFLEAYHGRSADLTGEMTQEDLTQFHEEIASIETEIDSPQKGHPKLRARLRTIKTILEHTTEHATGGVAAAYLLQLLQHIHP